MLFQGCSLPFACTSKARRPAWLPPGMLLAKVSASSMEQPALCLQRLPARGLGAAAASPLLLSCIQACRLPGFKRLKPLKPSNSLASSFHLQLLHCFLAGTLTTSEPSGRQPLLFQGCAGKALCLHIPREQLPPSPDGQSAFAVPGLKPALCLHIALSCSRHSSLPFARLQTLKTLKTLATPPRQASTKPSGKSGLCAVQRFAACPFPAHPSTASFHQARGRQRCPGKLQPALCLHIALSC